MNIEIEIRSLKDGYTVFVGGSNLFDYRIDDNSFCHEHAMEKLLKYALICGQKGLQVNFKRTEGDEE